MPDKPASGNWLLTWALAQMSNRVLWQLRFTAEDEIRRRADRAGQVWDQANVR